MNLSIGPRIDFLQPQLSRKVEWKLQLEENSMPKREESIAKTGE